MLVSLGRLPPVFYRRPSDLPLNAEADAPAAVEEEVEAEGFRRRRNAAARVAKKNKHSPDRIPQRRHSKSSGALRRLR